MPRAMRLVLTILLASTLAIFIGFQQEKRHLDQLLSSTSTTDQLEGISLCKNLSFEKKCVKLAPLLENENEASYQAQMSIIQSAFNENKVPQLSNMPLLLNFIEAANHFAFGVKKSVSSVFQLPDFSLAQPWMKFLSVLCSSESSLISFDELCSMPPKDRDGSILLATLAIEKNAPTLIEPILTDWIGAYDDDRVSIAILLAGLRNIQLPTIQSGSEKTLAISRIINEKNFKLAWRTMHRSDGQIHPDIALAGMIADPNRFLPELIKSAKLGQWQHPEQPIAIAWAIYPEIAASIPEEFIINPPLRLKWWDYFACGLLQE